MVIWHMYVVQLVVILLQSPSPIQYDGTWCPIPNDNLFLYSNYLFVQSSQTLCWNILFNSMHLCSSPLTHLQLHTRANLPTFIQIANGIPWLSRYASTQAIHIYSGTGANQLITTQVTSLHSSPKMNQFQWWLMIWKRTNIKPSHVPSKQLWLKKQH